MLLIERISGFRAVAMFLQVTMFITIAFIKPFKDKVLSSLPFYRHRLS